MLFGENGKLKELFRGPSAQVETVRCPSGTPLRLILQSKTALTLRRKEVACRLLTAGLQCQAEVEKRFPEGNPIHHVQRMLCSPIYLSLYHKYSIIYIYQEQHILWGVQEYFKSARKANPALPFSQRKTPCSQWTKHHKLSMELEVSNI